ncbi:MAG: transcriptional repressor [candidate division Zixibacteria bacterium]|nr:transcriptional repressor [candidate division Zixibacteria bacterium]
MQETDTTELLVRFQEVCRRHELKVTPQRLAIYRELMTSDKHPSAEAMYRRIREDYPSISFDTVNRTLHTFAEIGVVDVVEGWGQPRRFDPNTRAHHHVHCIRCGEIEDFACEAYDRLKVPPAISHRFRITGRRVVLAGVCRKCR